MTTCRGMTKSNMLVTMVAFAAVVATAGASGLQNVPAPAPAPNQPMADLLFALSADKAVFSTPTTLELTGVAPTVQCYGRGASTGLISTAPFTNSTAGAKYVAADGAWLNAPDAALFTLASNGSQAMLLQLSAPSFNADAKSVTFTVKALPAEAGAIKYSGGVTDQLVMEHLHNVGTPVAAGIQAGATWSDVTLFIDANRASLGHVAATEWGWGGWRHGWGGGWGGYNRGWGYYSWGR